MLVMGLLLRHRFCRWVCAPGLMQMLFGWLSPMSLRVQFQGLRHCTDCRRCEEVCFMEARPRGRREKDISCINCGLCVQACKRELGPRGALLRLGFGQPREDAMISKKPKEVF
jgi:polyferredoxin